MKSITTSLAAACLLGAAATAQTTAPKYAVYDLGVVGPQGSPFYIANNGVIAGAVVAPNNALHAAVWFLGMKLDFGKPGLGGPNSEANGLNSNGQAVGAAQTAVANSEDFCGFTTFGLLPSATACAPFVWQGGVMTKLPTLGGPNGVAMNINNNGVAVGYAETGSPDSDAACPVGQFQGAIWNGGTAAALPNVAGDTDGLAWAVNNSGQAVGATGSCSSYNVDTGLYLLEKHATLWSSGAVIDLGNLGGTGAGAGNHACGINNLGQVVGHADLPGDQAFHGFYWSTQTGMVDIGTLPGDFASLAIGISDQGLAVGSSLDSNFDERAILYANGVMTDLNTLALSNPQKLYLVQANSIDARGEITGFAADAAGNLHGFLATQVSAGSAVAASEPVTPAALSPEAKKILFRQTGIRRR